MGKSVDQDFGSLRGELRKLRTENREMRVRLRCCEAAALLADPIQTQKALRAAVYRPVPVTSEPELSASERGRLGGLKRAERTSPADRSADASAAARALWNSTP
jgi:hypothetical protein